MVAISYKGGGAHAVVAVGYETDSDGVYNIFCLDPDDACNPTSYWNMVIAINQYKGRYKHQCLTSNEYNCPQINISEILTIKRNK